MTLRFFFARQGLALGFVLIAMIPIIAVAQETRPVRLHAPAVLVNSGLIKHILPRFTLKTRVRVELVPDPAEADIALGDTGEALFAGPEAVWHMALSDSGHAGTQKFADWLLSDVGGNTVASFAPQGSPIYGPPPENAAVEVAAVYDADARIGHEVSRAKCTRCHAIDDATRGWGIGSTPSFSVLRSLNDWEERFYAFYTLNPHPSFTIVEGLTLPFPAHRPPPITPIEVTVDEVDAIVAYVATMDAADLGAPLVQQ
jgi:hypothetical protein